MSTLRAVCYTHMQLFVQAILWLGGRVRSWEESVIEFRPNDC